MQQSYEIKKSDRTCVSIERETREAKIEAEISESERKDCEIDTGLNFLNHMIETVSWRACMNISLRFTGKRFRLSHVICEDSGLALGKAFAELVKNKMQDGIEAAGSAIMGIDEAMAISLVSFEGRSGCFIERKCEGSKLERVEDMLSADLAAFFDGFSQGARATVRINMESGTDPHHTWEAAFRSFGCAIKEALKENRWRKGVIGGVKGTMD